MFAQDFDAATFKGEFAHNLENAHEIRMAVRQAKKYVLDYSASRQITDLGSPNNWIINKEVNSGMAQLRRSARSPHQKLWVEFNSRARRERLIEISKPVDKSEPIARPSEVFPRAAWLIEHHPDHPSVHRATMVLDLNGYVEIGVAKDSRIPDIQPLPFAWAWNTDDEIVPSAWPTTALIGLRSKDVKAGKIDDFKIRLDVPEMSLGIVGYVDDYIYITRGFGKHNYVGRIYKSISGEFAGELRYIMAFLASLSSNKVVDRSNVRTAAPKYTASRVLPPYEFTEVRITVPRKRRLAAYLAQHGESGIKKRRHEVDGYWRLFEHGSGPFCKEQHTWESSGVTNKQYCANCPAWRTWVMEHERGDPLLGRVEHIKRVVT